MIEDSLCSLQCLFNVCGERIRRDGEERAMEACDTSMDYPNLCIAPS